ncbi:MAG: hypothetical protein M5R40_26055 [Anaerolineae bacterium]|nr:hypothetical protein [Anaerolineae bacterium]
MGTIRRALWTPKAEAPPKAQSSSGARCRATSPTRWSSGRRARRGPTPHRYAEYVQSKVSILNAFFDFAGKPGPTR